MARFICLDVELFSRLVVGFEKEFGHDCIVELMNPFAFTIKFLPFSSTFLYGLRIFITAVLF
jgi:hypothetical protein